MKNTVEPLHNDHLGQKPEWPLERRGRYVFCEDVKLMHVLTYKYIPCLKHIKKKKKTPMPNKNRDQQRAIRMKALRRPVYTVSQSLINWPLSAIFNWQLGRVLMALAAVER